MAPKKGRVRSHFTTGTPPDAMALYRSMGIQIGGREDKHLMIHDVTRVGGISPSQAAGFFVGWPSPPSSEQLVAVMDGSYRRVWALDGHSVESYINAISDGVLNAFLPWLEVLPAYQGQGIGRELVRRIVTELGHLYAIDLCCDPALIPYYEKLGFRALAGAGIRQYKVLT